MNPTFSVLTRSSSASAREAWGSLAGAAPAAAAAVAVKVIRPESLSSGSADEARRRFEREAHATSTLRSPHTVAVFDYGTTEQGDVYYAMELLEGLSLAALVAEFGPVPPERAVYRSTASASRSPKRTSGGSFTAMSSPPTFSAACSAENTTSSRCSTLAWPSRSPPLDGKASPVTTGHHRRIAGVF